MLSTAFQKAIYSICLNSVSLYAILVIITHSPISNINMKLNIIYKILLTITIVSGIAILLCLFTAPDIGYWFAFPFCIGLVTTILLKLKISVLEADNKHLSQSYKKYLTFEQQQQLLKSDYCVVDIETTGLNKQSDQIIEISALRVRNNKITDTFTSLVKPTIAVPSSATYVNRITNEMLENAPPLKDVIARFIEFVGSDTVIGHNISGFDLKFIKRDCKKKSDKLFDNDYIDTLILAQNTFLCMPNYKLPTLCRELGIKPPRHRAKSDCISTKKLFDKIKAYNNNND